MSAKQQRRRPLPSLLYKSLFYAPSSPPRMALYQRLPLFLFPSYVCTGYSAFSSPLSHLFLPSPYISLLAFLLFRPFIFPFPAFFPLICLFSASLFLCSYIHSLSLTFIFLISCLLSLYLHLLCLPLSPFLPPSFLPSLSSSPSPHLSLSTFLNIYPAIEN